jgi:hypothetical protein
MGLRGIGSFPLSRRGTDTDPTPAPEIERQFFTAEVIELFLKLEREPNGHLLYGRPDSHRLAIMLGLLPQWLKSCHVNDRSSRSGYPPGHLTDIAFWKVREVRKALLAICAHRAGGPKAEAAQTQATERVRGREREAMDSVEPEAQSSAEPSSAA